MKIRHCILFLLLSVQFQARAAENSPGFSSLIGTNLDLWEQLNTITPSFVFDGGVLQVTGGGGWLKSPRQYSDFELRGQVMFLGRDADSGIFVRVQPGTDFIQGWPGDSYQVQFRDISGNTSDNPLPLANLYRHEVADGETSYQREQVFESYMGLGEWHPFSIRVVGELLTVEFNGQLVTTAAGIDNPSGFIGIQSESGFTLFRNLEINEL